VKVQTLFIYFSSSDTISSRSSPLDPISQIQDLFFYLLRCQRWTYKPNWWERNHILST